MENRHSAGHEPEDEDLGMSEAGPGLAVRKTASGSGWEVIHLSTGLRVFDGVLRQQRFAEEAMAELLATGADFTTRESALRDRDAWGPACGKWLARAKSSHIDPDTGEYYNWHVNDGALSTPDGSWTLDRPPSAKQAAEYRSGRLLDSTRRPGWDGRPHGFRPQGNKIYCDTCGGSKAGAQHS